MTEMFNARCAGFLSLGGVDLISFIALLYWLILLHDYHNTDTGNPCTQDV